MSQAIKYSQFDAAAHSTHNLIVNLVPTGSRVLEIGCSTGYMSEVLKKQLDCSVTGVEIFPQAGELAREHCDRVIIANIETLDLAEAFGEERFDVILFADVLEHLRDPGTLLIRLQPLLAESGSIIASIPNIAHGSVRLALLGGEFRYQETGLLDDSHLRFFTRESVQSLFEDAGYLITHWSRQRIEIDQTEIAFPVQSMPEVVREMITRDPEATTYQFIVKAVRAEAAMALRQVRAEIVAASAEYKATLSLRQSEHDKTLNDLRAKLHEREQLVQALRQQKADKAQALRQLEVEKTQISLMRQEEIAWLRGELSESRKEAESRALSFATMVAELQVELCASQQAVEALKHQAEKNDQLTLAKSERITNLSAELAYANGEMGESEKAIRDLQAELQEERRAVQALENQTEQQERMILARDEGIAWLRNELSISQSRVKPKRDLILRRPETTYGPAGSEQRSIQYLLRHPVIWLTTQKLYWRFRSIVKQMLFPVLPDRIKKFLQRAFNHSQIPPAKSHQAQSLQALTAAGEEEPEGSQVIARSPSRAAAIKEGDFFQRLTLLPNFKQNQTPAVLNHNLPARPFHSADVICFSIVDWETRYQRPQQIMSQFAADGRRVFYISSSRFQPAYATQRVVVRLIKENVYEVSLAAQHQPNVYGEAIAGRNQTALLASLDELRRTFQIDEAIAYVMIASWGNVALEARKQWGWRVIYDCMDEWENFPGIKRPVLNLEKRLVEDCDLLVVTAERLYEKWRGRQRPKVLARNATDYCFYSERCLPNDIFKNCEIKHPLIGYYGAIADWFDVELMAYVAASRPEYTFVLLGGVFDVDVSRLEALPNVRLLGQQAYETMPQYLYHFDACIIPFKINPITEATDPVKLYEYFSGGKPVVSVALSEIEQYREYLYLATDKEDFVTKLDEAIAEDDPQLSYRRQALARQHTWESRCKQIEVGLVEAVPRASIIIVTYNNLALNKLCLESVIRNTQYLNYEVIVVDNNSMDETPAYLRRMADLHHNIKVILNLANHGFARANNQGIAQSVGEYLVLLNNDTIVPPGWLSRLLLHLRNPAIGLVGPVTNSVGNEAKIEVPYQTWGEMEAFAQKHTWANDCQVADIHMLAMFCVALRRETYDRVGPLDEQFGIGMFEDDDYARRVKEHGLRVICAADAFVHHFGQAAFKKLIENGQYDDLFNENRRRYETKWNVKWMPSGQAPVIFEKAH